MVSWREIASCWELQWRWRRLQVGRKREAEEVGGLRGDEVVDGRKGTRVEMVATSHDPHGMPDKGTSGSIEHSKLTGPGICLVRGVSLFAMGEEPHVVGSTAWLHGASLASAADRSGRPVSAG